MANPEANVAKQDVQLGDPSQLPVETAGSEPLNPNDITKEDVQLGDPALLPKTSDSTPPLKVNDYAEGPENPTPAKDGYTGDVNKLPSDAANITTRVAGDEPAKDSLLPGAAPTETETQSSPAVEKTAEQNAPAVAAQPEMLRSAAILLRPFEHYAKVMGKGQVMDTKGVILNQRKLYRAFKDLFATQDPQVFTQAWNALLKLWHAGQDSAFEPGRRLYRQIDSLELNFLEQQEFNTILRFMEALHDPVKRRTNLLAIDLNRALPQIAKSDPRGYLGSFVRRVS